MGSGTSVGGVLSGPEEPPVLTIEQANEMWLRKGMIAQVRLGVSTLCTFFPKSKVKEAAFSFRVFLPGLTC